MRGVSGVSTQCARGGQPTDGHGAHGASQGGPAAGEAGGGTSGALAPRALAGQLRPDVLARGRLVRAPH